MTTVEIRRTENAATFTAVAHHGPCWWMIERSLNPQLAVERVARAATRFRAGLSL